MGPRSLLFLTFVALSASPTAPAAEDWIRNDLERAREIAARTGRPMLVVFRCVP